MAGGVNDAARYGFSFYLVRITLDLLLLIGYNNPFKGVVCEFGNVPA